MAIEIPLGANGLHTFPLVVSYPDGTRESSSLTVSAVPIPADSERHQVTYRASDVTGGESVTVSPTETNLPTDILITLADNTGLTANGWTLDVTADGKLTATAPDDADGIIEIALTVTYPDGSTEPATAQITATPAPTDDESEQPITPSRPKAGGSSSGSS